MTLLGSGGIYRGLEEMKGKGKIPPILSNVISALKMEAVSSKR
jgi:hypothetical protein